LAFWYQLTHVTTLTWKLTIKIQDGLAFWYQLSHVTTLTWKPTIKMGVIAAVVLDLVLVAE